MGWRDAVFWWSRLLEALGIAAVLVAFIAGMWVLVVFIAPLLPEAPLPPPDPARLTP